jgi:hypothetical protein
MSLTNLIPVKVHVIHTLTQAMKGICSKESPCRTMPSFQPAEHIGSCYLMPNHFKSTEGQIQITIVSNRFHPIGQVSVLYNFYSQVQLKCSTKPASDCQTKALGQLQLEVVPNS